MTDRTHFADDATLARLRSYENRITAYEKLVARLVPYVRHQVDCEMRYSMGGCTCGYTAIEREIDMALGEGEDG